ncbi:MAG TPA: InlB B-repeat-containing protein, partial [Gaiellaceae bacterium]|nr:InlB B-repeat-containing protein [Gaiellaceae bacterium]
MLGRSARWVAAAAACVVVLVLPSAIRADVVGVTVSADSTTAGDTNAVWTVSFTPQADLDFLASDTVTVEFPSGFDVSGATFESFSGCFLSSSPSASGQQVTVPLPPGCSIVGGTPSSVELSGISPAAGTYAASEFAVSTSQETTPVAATGSDIVISGGGGGGGATSVTNVTFSGSSTAAAATSTWTVGFTSSSSGQLAGGAGFGYVLVTFPSGFGTPSSAAFATGFSCNGQAAVPQDVGGGTVELDLPSGCTLAASTAATVTLTLTNPSSAGSYTGASVSTSSDQNFVAPASAIAISGQLFTVQFDRNGGSGTMADQTFTGGVAQALDTNAFTFTSHTFAGWNTAADGSGTAYSDGQSITVNADTTLYAQWVGPPAQLVVSRQPAGATALSPFATQPVVRVEDAQGHLVTGSTATITASASSCAGTLAGTTTQTAAAGVAAFTDLSIGAAGSCTLRFADTTDNLTTTSQTFTAGKIPTSLSVSISPDKPAYTFGDTVTITATATGIPDGTTITIASLNATLHGGTASVSTPVFTLEPLPADVSFDAKYAGDTSHATAKGSIGRKLDKAPSATTVAWDAGSGTLTATVASRDPLSLGGDPTPFKAVFGSVEFFDAASGKSLGTAQISQGVATLTPSASALPAGTHTIRASSTGHHWLLPSTGQLGNVVVPTRKTDLTVTASKTTLQWDRPLTLTVAVP